jgi:hypothetical protein
VFKYSVFNNIESSIIPTVSFESFFKNLHWNRRETQILCRVLSNHTRLRHHLGRINIVDDMLCTCGQDYESVDHRLWYCQSYVIARVALFVSLSKFNIFSPVPVRDLLALQMFNVLEICVRFFVENQIEI